MEQCGECYAEDVVKYYCCCIQIFLCVKCALLHYEHFLLKKDIDFSDAVSPSFVREQISVRIDALKLEINEFHANEYRRIQSGEIPNSTSSFPNYRLSVQVNKALLNKVTSVYVYTCNEKSQILKINITQNIYKLLPVRLNYNLKAPFWVLEWKNCLVILGGKIGNASNKNIELINLKDLSVSSIAELPEEISSFSPIIFEDCLFIIGGRIFPSFQRSSPINTVLCLNLNTRQYLENFYLTQNRFRVTSCMVKKTLAVLSENCPSLLEYKQLDEGLSFQKIQFKLDFTFGSCIAYDSDILYFFNNQGVFKCEDLNSLAFTQIASFENIQQDLSSCIWNQSHAPCFHEKCIYFFSLKQMICIDEDGLVSVFKYKP